MFGRKCWIEDPCVEHSPQKCRAECSNRFPSPGSFHASRSLFSRKDAIEISIHCLEVSAPEAVQGEVIPSCPNLESDFRSLGLIRPNLHLIYHVNYHKHPR